MLLLRPVRSLALLTALVSSGPSAIGAMPPTSHAECPAIHRVQGIWFTCRCPSRRETDALQVVLDTLLDTADHILASGLASGGYRLLATDPCDTLQQPAQRAAITRYLAERQLNIAFAPRDVRCPG